MKKHQLAYQKYNRMNRDLIYREWVIMWYKGYFEKFSNPWHQVFGSGSIYAVGVLLEGGFNIEEDTE